MRSLLTSLFTFICIIVIGQPFDTIYYNQNWEITAKTKGVFYRVTGMNVSGLFYQGQFSDYMVDGNQKIASGYYSDYKRNGEFIEYYVNGNIRSKGQYLDNKHTGLWTYNYPNAQTRMIVDFTKKYFNIIEYRDSLNNITLGDGTGECVISVPVFGMPCKLVAYFVDGNRDGKWIYTDTNGKTLLVEKYKDNAFLFNKFYKPLAEKYILGTYLTNDYFNENKYNNIEKMACERDFDVKSVPFITHLTKEINFSNSVSLTYLNSQMPIDAILSMAKDQNNAYWFGTANLGLVRFDTTFTFYNKKNSPIKGDYISHITVDEDNNVWFSYGSDRFDYDVSTAGLACLSEGKIRIFNTKNSGLTCNSINDIVIDKNKIKWFASSNCILSFDELNNKWTKRINDKKIIRIVDTLRYNNKDEFIRYAKQVSAKYYSWDESKSGNSRSGQGANDQNTIKHYAGMYYYESPSMFLNIEASPESKLFINSINSGCSTFDGLNWESVSDSNQITCLIFQLKNNQISEASQNLLLEILLKNSFNMQYVLPFEKILVDANRTLWILAGNSILKMANDQLLEFKIREDGIRSYADSRLKKDFYYLFLDSDGTIWAGINGGIIKIE